MITLPWTSLASERPKLYLAVKVQLVGTPSPPPLLASAGSSAVSIGGDVYDPDASRLVSVGSAHRTSDTPSRNPCQVVVLDDADWTWRKRIEANTFQQARCEVRLVENAAKHFLLRVGQGVSHTAVVGNLGRQVSMTFASLLTRNGDTRIRAVDQDMQRRYDEEDTSFSYSDIAFNAVWGYQNFAGV